MIWDAGINQCFSLKCFQYRGNGELRKTENIREPIEYRSFIHSTLDTSLFRPNLFLNLYERMCQSVHPSVGTSVSPSCVSETSRKWRTEHKALGKLFILLFGTNLFLSCRLIQFVGNAERSDASEIETLALDWGKEFLECGKSGKMRGFEEKNMTPYNHVLVVHAAPQVRKFGRMKDFNGQGLERENDEFKKTHMRRTNCKDIITSLRQHKRREIGVRNIAIKKKRRKDARPVKLGCQVKIFLTRLLQRHQSYGLSPGKWCNRSAYN